MYEIESFIKKIQFLSEQLKLDIKWNLSYNNKDHTERDCLIAIDGHIDNIKQFIELLE
jgi:hypothetical protein